MKLTTTQLMIGAVGVAVAGYLYMQNKKKKQAVMGGGQAPDPEQKTDDAPVGGGGGGFGGGSTTTAPIPAVVVATPSVTPPKAPEEKKPSKKPPVEIINKPAVPVGKPISVPNVMPTKNFVDTDTEFMSFTHLDFDGGFDY